MKLKPLLFLSLFIIVLATVSAYIFSSRYKLQSSTEHSTPVRVMPEDKSVPPTFKPDGKQMSYATTFQTDTMRMEVNKVESYYDDQGTLQYLQFSVRYEHLLNTTARYSNLIDVGCVAAQDKTFKEVPSIFTSGSFSSRQALPTRSLQAFRNYTFGAYETRYAEARVSGSCQFIGTSDGQYWWAVVE